MDLLQNPFHILNATQRDKRSKIMELSEERSLLLDSSDCTQARSDLTIPSRRLSMEIAWLPGLGPKRTSEVLSVLENSVSALLGMYKLTPIVRANLLAAGLSRLPVSKPDDVAEWILALARAFDKIAPDELCAVINEERIASGFPEVKDLSMVEVEIQERRRHYRQVIKDALNNLSAKELVEAVTAAVESATDNGEEHGPILIYDMVDSYEIEAQDFLKNEAQNIKTLVETIGIAADAERPDSTLATMVNNLIRVVKNWDTVAQPIQVSTKSRGADHVASNKVAELVRELAIHLFNDHDKLDLSRLLTNMLQKVFAEVAKVAELTAEDVSALDGIAKQRFQLIKVQNIETLVENIKTAAAADRPDSTLAPMVNNLIQVVKNWNIEAPSIHVSIKKRGLDYDYSRQVAELVRELAIHIFNDHDKLDFSRLLTNMLQEVFAEVAEIADLTAEDASTLNGIAKQRVQLIKDAKNRAEEWRREITYEADVGVLFKDKLCISPECIEWKGRRWDLDSITRMRWGGTRHSVNGVSTGTIYSVVFGNSSAHASIELRKHDIYSNFIDRLWKSVGIRLLTEYLEGLRDGKQYRFGTTVINDQGIELERKRLFSSNERAFCRWTEIVTWNGAGVFCIGKKEDRKLTADFSYQNEDNIHVLEAAVSMFCKQGGSRFSSLLG